MMLRFFQHVRQKLMKQNKVRTYILYAIGEIMLVVIGILIALQVNNWNEERKHRTVERRVMQQLLEDAREDSVFFMNRKDGLNQIASGWNPILLLSKEESRDSARSIAIPDDFMFFTVFVYESYLINNNPNPFETVSNPEIKDLLRDYKNHHIYVRNAFIQFNTYAEEYGVPLHMKFNGKIEEFKQNRSTYGDAEGLFAEKEFQNSIGFLMQIMQNVQIQNDRFLATNESLITVLCETLGTKKR